MSKLQSDQTYAGVDGRHSQALNKIRQHTFYLRYQATPLHPFGLNIVVNKGTSTMGEENKNTPPWDRRH